MVTINIEKLKDLDADVKMAMMMFGYVANEKTLCLELCGKAMSPVEICAYLNVNVIHYKTIIGKMRTHNMIMLAGSGNFEIIILNPDFCLDLEITQYIQTLSENIFSIHNFELLYNTQKKPITSHTIFNKSVGRFEKGKKHGKH